jgi:GT2 family glycosyltransferase
MDRPMRTNRLPRPISERVVETLGRTGLASAAAALLPKWTDRFCERHGLLQGAVDLEHYRRASGKAFASESAAALHYLTVGSARDVSPRAGFSPLRYRRLNPDVERDGYEPFAHWLKFGREEGRGTDTVPDPPPVELSRLLARPPPNGGRPTVDIVMPVYGSRALALQAIDSVLAAGTKQAYELVVVDDASPDPVLRGELEALAAAGLITLLVNERNLGFVDSVNRGFAAHADRDVVLLNSDTKVFDGWLDRLMAALRTERTATATPLSNAATILSYPATLCDNRVLPDACVAQWDELCAALAAQPVDIPTGVGFCMAVKRASLDQIGFFDRERFGRGYGEENDFCLRATAAGWRHVAATGVFVWHRGGASFGSEREAFIAAAQATIERLHPGYAKTIGRFIRRDPLAATRMALDVARLGRDPRRKRLRLGATARPVPRDVLDIVLTPDLPPYADLYRLVPAGAGAYPNLPRIGPASSAVELSSFLQNLGIREFAVGFGGRSVLPLQACLEEACQRNGIEMTSVS